MCLCVSYFLYLSVDEHLACFSELAIVNDATINMGCRYLFMIVFSFPSNIYLQVELLDHMIVIFSVFWETSILFSMVAVQYYIPINSCTSVIFSSQPCQCLLSLLFLIVTILRGLLLRRKVMTNIDSILKSRFITLPTKVHLVKAMVFPLVMYGCESWTVKKAERQKMDVFELWCWRRIFGVSWTARRSNQSILK